jgi:opacity protein-like surface antigen
MYKSIRSEFLSSVLVAAALGISSSPVLAETIEPRFYLGGELNYSKHNYDQEFKDSIATANGSIKSKVPGMSILAGARFYKNFGLELGYTFLKAAKSTGNTNGNLKAKNAYLDLLGYVPIINQIELVGTMGVGRMQTKETEDLNQDQFIERIGRTGLRIGAGAQYNIDNKWSARAMLRYQKVGGKGKDSNIGMIKNTTSLSAGIAYLF